MKLAWKFWSMNKQNQMILKLATAILLMGIAFRLFFNQSESLEPSLNTPFSEKTEQRQQDQHEVVTKPSVSVSDVIMKPPVTVTDDHPPPPPPEAGSAPAPGVGEQESSVSGVVQQQEDDTSPNEADAGKCDLFIGDWIPSPAIPMYTNASCPLIEGHQNCMRNGRPDSDYLYWRWNPRNCELPRFDAQRFLDLMRNKTWALIGDSISRNHVQSLLCMLSTVEEAVEVYHDEDYKTKRWHFPSYNLTIWNIWSPFLVQAAIFEDYNGVSSAEVQLHLDKLDKNWTDVYQNSDFSIISTGKWFLKAAIYHENNTVVGCHICPGKNITEVGFVFSYERALRKAMNFIATTKNKGMVFFRTSTPDHFENGEWHNGGVCPKTTPAKDGEIELKDLNRILMKVELEAFKNASQIAVDNGVSLKLLDFTKLLLTRPDGHPGPYREFHPFAKGETAKVQNDCLHWCLPGPIDYWNDVIMELVVNG